MTTFNFADGRKGILCDRCWHPITNTKEDVVIGHIFKQEDLPIFVHLNCVLEYQKERIISNIHDYLTSLLNNGDGLTISNTLQEEDLQYYRDIGI